MKYKATLALFALLVIWIFPVKKVTAQIKDPDPYRFAKEIQSFKLLDEKNWFPNDALLFVGSSSIRMWKSYKAFPKYKIINRGFGGSHISDVNYFSNNLVLKYKPKMIVFYAGDNDIFAGKSPERVLNDYKKFVSIVSDSLPETKIIFISIKPSLNRWKFWENMRKANNLIKDFCSTLEKLYYLDISKTLLTDNGKPEKDLFKKDGLHLNQNGYNKWNNVLYPVITFDILRSMAKLDQFYIPVLAYTSTGNYSKALTAFKSLKSFWEKYKHSYKKYFFIDSLWNADFENMNEIFKSAEKQLKSNNLKKVHETLEPVRIIQMRLRKRNGLPYFIDNLIKFHEPVEKLVRSVTEDKGKNIAAEKWLFYKELAARLNRIWKDVNIEKLNNKIFNMNKKNLTFINSSIQKEKTNLYKLNKIIASRNNAGLLKSAKAVKKVFADVFKSFGKF